MTDMSKEAISTSRALKLALGALKNGVDGQTSIEMDEAVTALREALAKSRSDVEQPAPATELREQEPVSCPVCNQVHTILDADESQIIRNAKDGYPDGRTPRLLTLQERVTALCQYASDWQRWCLEKENTSPQAQRKPLRGERFVEIARAIAPRTVLGLQETIPVWIVKYGRAIEAEHNIKGDA